MSDNNTVLDELSKWLTYLRFARDKQPENYPKEHWDKNDSDVCNAIRIYKAECEVVEAALALEGNHTRLHRLSCECVAIDYWDKLQIAIENLKRIRNDR